MKQEKSITRNYIYNLIYQILTIVLPLFTTPYLSRVLGAENIGIYSYTYSIITYFMIIGSLGISVYGQREIAYVQNDKKKRTIIFYEITLLKFITMSISMVIFYFTFMIRGQYSYYYKLLSLHMISTAIEIIWFFQGLEEFKKTVIRNIMVKFVCLISVFVFVKNANDLWKYIIIYGLSEVIGNISLWFYLPKYLVKIDVKKIKLKRHIKPTIELFIPQISLQIYNLIDRTMIGNEYTDKSEVGYYEQAQKAINLLTAVVTSLGTVLIPRISNMFAKKENDKIKEYLYKSLKFIYFLSFPFTFGIILISRQFVPIFFGDGYERVIYILYVISPIIILTGITNVLGTQYLIPTKKDRKYTQSIIIGMIINIILNYFLIPQGGAIAASVTTIISQIAIVIVQLKYCKEMISAKQIVKFTKNYFFASLVMLLMGETCNKVFNNVYITIIIAVITYFSIMYFCNDEIFNTILKKIKHIITKVKKEKNNDKKKENFN